MKKIIFLPFALCLMIATSCNQSKESKSTEIDTETMDKVGQSGVQDDVSNPNIVQVAISSKDHTTLVTAIKAAGLSDALSNAGPFTVFAPTNKAFEKLPSGTVEGLLKPENKNDLENILGYHTYIGVIDGILLQDGVEYDMVFGGKVKITKNGVKTFVNGSEIVGTIKTSNGVIHVIGDVLLPK
jgi:uncharacterized surface protein with fasciclin (FAS1) repeats